MSSTFVTRNSVRRTFVTRNSVTRSFNKYDPDAQAFFNRTPTQYDAAHKQAISDFIRGIKSDNGYTSLSQMCDVMYFIGSPTVDNSVINVVSPSFTALPINSPGFIANQGYTSDGLTSYIDTQYIPSLNATALSLNDFGIIIFHRTSNTINGVEGSFSNTTESAIFTFNNTISFVINDLTGSTTFTAVGNSGLLSAARINLTTANGYINGAQVLTYNSNSISLPTISIYILARNNNSMADTFTNSQESFCCLTKGTINQAAFNTRFQTLKAAFSW